MRPDARPGGLGGGRRRGSAHGDLRRVALRARSAALAAVYVLGLALAGTGTLAAVAPGQAAAQAAITVQVPEDCSLVGALVAAQDGNATGECLGLATNLPPEPFVIKIEPAAGPIVLTAANNETDGPNGLPDITGNVTVESATDALAVIERNPLAPSFRIFHVAATGSLTLDHVEVTGGLARGGAGAGGGLAPGGGGAGMGGAIFSHGGTVNIEDSELVGNAAAGGQGGTAGGGNGGTGGGGGMAGPGQPGFVYFGGSSGIETVLLPGDGGPPNGSSVTEVINAGVPTVTGITYAGFGGGGAGGSIVSLGTAGGGFGGGGGGGGGSTDVAAGSGGFGGGGGATFAFSNSTTPTGVGGFGGGAGGISGAGDFIPAAGTITGGGGGGAGMGGAVFAYGGTLAIAASTLSGNSATGGAGGSTNLSLATVAGAAGGGFGGAVFAYGPAAVTVANATLAGNSASGQTVGGGTSTSELAGGGALYFYGTSAAAPLQAKVVNGTVTLNGAGALVAGPDARVEVGNTILAANGAGGTGDVSGPVTDLGGNVVGNATGATGFTAPSDRTGGAATPLDPLLGGLLANGGPTETMALETGSPAIGTGVSSICQTAPVSGLDQRGEPRPVSICDAGAYQGVPVGGLAVTTTALPAATVGRPYIDFLAASGGTSPYTWSIAGGSLPAGMFLDAAQGALYGTPTAAGPATFTLQVSDTLGQVAASGPLSLDVASNQAAAGLRLTLSPEVVTGGQTRVTAAVYDAQGDALSGQTVDLRATSGSLSLSSVPGSVAGAVYAATLSGLTAAGPVTVTGSAGALVAQAVAFVPPPGTSVAGASEGDNTVPGGGLAVGGPGSGTPDLSAQATGGTGVVTLVRDALGSDPAGPPAFHAGAGVYFDASLGADASYSGLSIHACDLQGGTLAYWWTGKAWQTVSDAVYDPGSGCLTITVGGSTVPSLADLTGTPFAVALAPQQSTSPGGTAVSFGSGSAPATTAQVAATVGASGGTLATADGAFTLAVPAGAISGTGTLGVTEACPPPAPSGMPSDTVVASCVFTLGGATLAAPEAATIQYDASALGGLPAGRLSVYEQNAAGTWSFLPTAVDAAAGTVSVKLSGPATVAVLADTQRFPDVPPGYWASAAIDTVVAASIMDGFPGGSFQPGAAVTRAEFVKMLDLTVGLKVAGGATQFSDVPAAAWYAPYVAAALRAGIVDGTSATTFSPDATVTREQMAVMLARALRLSGTAAATFTDAPAIAPWALSSVEAAVAAGYLKGFPDGSFRPQATASRAQAAEVLAAAVAARA